MLLLLLLLLLLLSLLLIFLGPNLEVRRLNSHAPTDQTLI